MAASTKLITDLKTWQTTFAAAEKNNEAAASVDILGMISTALAQLQAAKTTLTTISANCVFGDGSSTSLSNILLSLS
jgi:hypothetical protein